MNWCCNGAKNMFDARLDCGEFLVAGLDRDLKRIAFINGFNMCHRKDYSDVIAATQRATELIKAEGISNFKMNACGIVRFCKYCGANLREFYGEDGGSLRDDDYVNELHFWITER